jgi:hypothetical protein
VLLLATAPVPARRRGARPTFQIVSIRGDVHVIPGDVPTAMRQPR